MKWLPEPDGRKKRAGEAQTIIASTREYQSEYCILRKVLGRRRGLPGWCWQFTMHRQNQKVMRAFSDLDYGSAEAALEAARAYRKAFMEAFPPVTNLQKAQKIKRHNTSGIPGVSRVIAQGKNCWRAAVSINGQICNRSFSVNLYGEERARQLAIAARQRLLAQLTPSFERVPHEARAVAETLFPESLRKIPEPKAGKWLDDETFRRKLAEIDAQFAPQQTRARRLYVNVNLIAEGKEVRVYVSDWLCKEKFLRTFGAARSLAVALARTRVFITESISIIHGGEAARSFMETYGNRFRPGTFSTAGQFRHQLIENCDAETGCVTWLPVA